MKNEYYKYDENGRIIIPNDKEISKLPNDGGEYWNRLVFEKSPYLLQHAANPVNWFPWDEEAFEMAKKYDKPIFLSIGYTTCHWCHVMEHESFENDEVAELMNETFVSVKVDREERPDIDNVYMEVTQIITGRGGWPMTVIMTPDKQPFFAGTYFPKQTRYNRIGMIDLVPKIKDLWDTNRDSLISEALMMTEKLQNRHQGKKYKEELSDRILDNTFNRFNNRFDDKYGGFGDAPKFPKPHDYLFLLKYYQRTKNQRALEMVLKSLKEMRMGGIYDQIGFGFHRYSTDKRWLVPHFEKMLYDQALLIHTYLEAYLITKDEYYSDVVNEIITYIIRDMTSPEGGFYSAEDADSEGEEGLFYLWKTDEMNSLFPKEDAEMLINILNLKNNGNWHEGRQNGTNIPHLKKTWRQIARSYNLSEVEMKKKFENFRTVLFNEREKRVHPQKDDKILSDWNGLMISAISRAGAILNNKNYIQIAEKANNFIMIKLRTDDGGLLKRFRNGESGLSGLIEDYSFVIWGLIELYQATFDPNYLESAIELSDYQLDHFWDTSQKGFFFTPDNGELLLVRSKESYDGAIPSGNSVAAYNFIRLGRILSRPDYEEIAHETLSAFSRSLNRSGSGYTMMLQAVEFITGPSFEILVFGNPESENTLAMLSDIQNIPQLNKVIIFGEDGNGDLNTLIPFIDMYPAGEENAPLVYVCKNYSCNLPTTNIDEVRKQLGQ